MRVTAGRPVLRTAAALLLAAAASVAAARAEEPFDAGVVAYEAGRFAEAERSFREALASDPSRPNVTFNLGNAAYRQGEWALAVLAYEWALALDPTDAQARENLRLTRARLVTDEIPSEATPAVARLLQLLGGIPPLLTLVVGLAAWTLGWALVALQVQRGTGTAWIGVALLLVSLVFGAHVAYVALELRGAPRGVLQAPRVEVRSGPGESYAALFTLHAGTTVREHEARGAWRRISLPQGPGGWIEADALAVIGRAETLPP